MIDAFSSLAPEVSLAFLPVLEQCDDYLKSRGCSSYVKTIYIGYSYGTEMVAAMYPHSDGVEVALALPVDHASNLLVNADHLTWRTMPVAAALTRESQTAGLLSLLVEACDRIERGGHEVYRDNEYFEDRRNRLKVADSEHDV